MVTAPPHARPPLPPAPGPATPDLTGDILASRGTYPLALPSASTAATTLRLHAALLRAAGIAPPPANGRQEDPGWLPVTHVGPVLVLGHTSPFASQPLPPFLVQPVLLSSSDYASLADAVAAQGPFLRHAWETTPAAPPSVRTALASPPDSPVPGHLPRSFLAALLQLGLLPASDVGPVRRMLDSDEDAPPPTPDLALAAWHITAGQPIARGELLSASPVPLPGSTPQLQERHSYVPIWFDPALAILATPDPSSPAFADLLQPRLRRRLLLVRVTSDALRHVGAGAADRSHVATVRGDAAPRASAAGLLLDARQLATLDPRNLEEPRLLVHWVLAEAVRRGASDIHLDLADGGQRVRLSVDNRGLQLLDIDPLRAPGVTAVLKQLSGIDLDARGHAEGRFGFSLEAGRTIDVRASLLVTAPGSPKWTLRLLDRSHGVRRPEDLGLGASELDTLRSAYSRPHGLILVSGPTGHGKTSTLYAILHALRDPSRFLYTLEDPVEYVFDGITQVEATSDPARIASGGMPFHEGITRILRADPDVIMVGEIRDAATARVAVEASMTGHLVLSTVHANDCFMLVARLQDLDVDPLLLARSLVLASSQRLVRRLCSCHLLEETRREHAEIYRQHSIPVPRFSFRPGRCTNCAGQGFRGRTAVLEFLPFDETLRDLLHRRAEPRALREHARLLGYRSLMEKGLDLAAQGTTTLQEVLQVCQAV